MFSQTVCGLPSCTHPLTSNAHRSSVLSRRITTSQFSEMVFIWFFSFVLCSKGVSSLFVMNESCGGLDEFEKSPSLDKFVYEVYSLGSHKAKTYLECAVDCFFRVNCLSVVFDEDTSSCFTYLTHMKDSYTRRSASTASYLQLKDPDNCTDIVVPCDAKAVCLNKRQNDGCVCDPGFTGDGLTCTDLDECNTPGYCDVNANCTNTLGSYACRCDDRYEGNGVTCTPETIKGQPCTQASDCIRENFNCSSGLCDCDLGYSFNITSNTCVTRCDNYGTDFSHQSTTYCVTGYNNAIYNVNTYSACRQYCMATTTFICKTFELWNNKCYLSSVSMTEVPASKWAAWSGCKYYQRHCA